MVAVLRQEPAMWLIVTSFLYYIYVMFWYTDVVGLMTTEIGNEIDEDPMIKPLKDDHESKDFRTRTLPRFTHFLVKAIMLGVWFAFWIKDIVFMARYPPSLPIDSNARYVSMFAFGTVATLIHLFLYLHSFINYTHNDDVFTKRMSLNLDHVNALGTGLSLWFLVGRLVLQLVVSTGILLEEGGTQFVKEEILAFVVALMLLLVFSYRQLKDGKRILVGDDSAGRIEVGHIAFETKRKVFPDVPLDIIVFGLDLSFLFAFNLMEVFTIMKFYGDYGRFWVAVVLRVVLPCLAAIWARATKYWFAFYVTACMLEYHMYTFFSGFHQADTSIVNPLQPYNPSNATDLRFRHEFFLSDWYEQGDTNPLAFNYDQMEGTYWTIAGIAVIPTVIYALFFVKDQCLCGSKEIS
jgi:hypothetical protein